MQDMSESERCIKSCCNVATGITTVFCGGGGLGGFGGMVYSVFTSTPIESWMTNMAIGAGLGTTAGLSIAAMYLIYKGCSAPNNAVDIEQPQEKTKLVTTKNLCKQSGQPGSSPASLFSTTSTVESADDLNDKTHKLYQI